MYRKFVQTKARKTETTAQFPINNWNKNNNKLLKKIIHCDLKLFAFDLSNKKGETPREMNEKRERKKIKSACSNFSVSCLVNLFISGFHLVSHFMGHFSPISWNWGGMSKIITGQITQKWLDNWLHFFFFFLFSFFFICNKQYHFQNETSAKTSSLITRNTSSMHFIRDSCDFLFNLTNVQNYYIVTLNTSNEIR